MSSSRDNFQAAYQQFRAARNKVFGAATLEDVSKAEGENNAQFLLRLSRWAAKHWRDNSDVWTDIDAARGLGREALRLAAEAWNQESSKTYMMQRGYCEAANVYLFTAPLDAISATYMSAKYEPFKGKTGESWLHVATANKAISDTPNTNFVEQYATVRAAMSDEDEDPYPSDDMAAILEDIRQQPLTAVPAEFKESAIAVKALFASD